MFIAVGKRSDVIIMPGVGAGGWYVDGCGVRGNGLPRHRPMGGSSQCPGIIRQSVDLGAGMFGSMVRLASPLGEPRVRGNT